MIDAVMPFVFALLVAALALTLTRLARGPSLPDRVVALDLVGMIIAGTIAACVAWMREPVFLDVLLVLATVSFFATVAFAHYLERKPPDDH